MLPEYSNTVQGQQYG